MTYNKKIENKINGKQCSENAVNTVIYARTNLAAEKSDCENQVQTAKEFIQQHPNLILKDIYADDGYSSNNLTRSEYQRMIKDIENGDIQLILIRDLSRLSRDMEQVIELTRFFSNHEVTCFCLNSNRVIQDLFTYTLRISI